MSDTVDAEALSSLAVFPLPDVVLVPRALLPLHIFEPRYRDMTRDVLNGSQLLALARLKPGYEADYDARPAVYPIAGLGEVVASERMDDGRYHLMVRGVGRVDVTQEIPSDATYRIARATLLEDEKAAEPQLLSPLRQQVARKCEQLAESIGAQGDALRTLVGDDAPAGSYADLLGGALITNADERQRLLEELEPAARLDQLLMYVSALLLRLGAPGDMLN